MKIKKWLTLLCFIIIVAILPCTSLSVSAANYIIAKSRTKLVDCIYTQLLDHKSDFEIKYYGNYEELDIKAIINKAYEIDDPDIAYDYDYLKWNINGYKYSTSYTSKEAHLKFHFTYLDTKTQQKKVDKAIKSIMKELKLSKKSDLNKVKIIHDYIVNTFTYDESQSKYSVYAGLLSKQHATVCQGYALMTYRMLKEAGINSIIVDSEDHAWNLVELNGKWYHLDTTWDDPVSSKPVLRYHYFLLGSKSIGQDHKLSQESQQRIKDLKIKISKTNYSLKSLSKKTLDKIYYAGKPLE